MCNTTESIEEKHSVLRLDRLDLEYRRRKLARLSGNSRVDAHCCEGATHYTAWEP